MTIKFLQAVTIEVPLDPSSGGTGFDNGTFTLQLGGNTIISNGGSIVLGGFTVTILESAAAVLNDNTATAGHVGFFSNAYKLADDANFFWDNTNKRLGIGNAAPSTTFHVTGTGRFTAGLELNWLGNTYVPYINAATKLLDGSLSFIYDSANASLQVGGTNTITATPRLAIKGAASDAATGPHIATYASGDIYPLMQILSFTHDNINISFDAYFDGSWKSSDAGSNYQIRKQASAFSVYYKSGIAQGAGITWSEAFRINSAGAATIFGTLLTTQSITSNGAFISNQSDAGTNNLVTALLINHSTSGTPTTGFGNALTFQADSSNNTTRTIAQVYTDWFVATDASRQGRMRFIVADSVGARQALQFIATGTQIQMGFFGSAGANKVTISGSRGGNAALASLLTALDAYGLIANGTTA